MGWKTSELPRYTVSAAQLSKGMSISPMLGLYYRELCKFKCTCGREPEYPYMLVHAQLWVCFHVRVGFWDSRYVKVHAYLHVRGVCVHLCLWIIFSFSVSYCHYCKKQIHFFSLILLSVRCFVFGVYSKVTHYRLIKYMDKYNGTGSLAFRLLVPFLVLV